MRLTQKTYLIFGTFLIIFIIQGGLTYLSSQQLEKATVANEHTNEIAKGVFELNLLTNGYLLTRGHERVVNQWDLKYQSLGVAIELRESEALKLSEEFNFLKTMKKEYQDIGDIFQKIKASETSSGLRDILIGQMQLKSQRLVNDAFQLSDFASEEILRVQKRGNTINIILFTLILIFVSFGAWITASNARNIGKLTETIESISKGKLDVQIDPKLKESKDELGGLARAFDRTIVSLKLVILRKDVAKKDLTNKQVPANKKDATKTSMLRKIFKPSLIKAKQSPSKSKKLAPKKKSIRKVGKKHIAKPLVKKSPIKSFFSKPTPVHIGKQSSPELTSVRKQTLKTRDKKSQANLPAKNVLESVFGKNMKNLPKSAGKGGPIPKGKSKKKTEKRFFLKKK